MNSNLFQYQSYLLHTFTESKTIYSDGTITNDHGQHHNLDLNSSVARIPGNVLLEFGAQTFCPYCNSSLIDNRLNYYPWRYHDIKWYGVQCHTCCWWLIQRREKEDDDLSNMYNDDLETYEGVISKFDQQLWAKPIKLVNTEVAEYRKALEQLNPTEVEVLIGQLFSQYFNCDVKHVGRSKDRGIDLIVLKSDTNIAIQVKHRALSRKGKSEGVIPIKEFVGALVGDKYEQGIYVTTDEKFSPMAKEYAQKVRANWAPLNLVTARELQDFMGIFKTNQWSEYDSIWDKK